MSHALGAVRFRDGDIMFYEYNGTADICISHLYNTKEEVHDNWRNSEWLECTCGKEEDVEIYTSYGWGSVFMGKACKNCKSISHEQHPHDIWEGTKDSQEPDWLKEKMKESQND